MTSQPGGVMTVSGRIDIQHQRDIGSSLTPGGLALRLGLTLCDLWASPSSCVPRASFGFDLLSGSILRLSTEIDHLQHLTWLLFRGHLERAGRALKASSLAVEVFDVGLALSLETSGPAGDGNGNAEFKAD